MALRLFDIKKATPKISTMPKRPVNRSIYINFVGVFFIPYLLNLMYNYQMELSPLNRPLLNDKILDEY